MKSRICIKFIISTIIIIACTNGFVGQQFNQIDIVSNRGEHIYISTINSGVTSDKQFTIISEDKILNGDDFDKTKSIKGLDPFIYSFSNDQLNLYFRNDIRYQVPFKPKSIKVQYFVLDNRDYVELYKKTFDNKQYHSVPNNSGKNGYPNMPKPPKENSK